MKIAATTLLAALAVTVAASTFAASITQVQAQGPPAKVAIILSTPPSERGTVASGGQGGGGCGRGCGI
jgi:hypothetical protein